MSYQIIGLAAAKLGCYGTANSDLLQCSLDDLASSVGGQAMFGFLVGGMLITGFYVASNGGLATASTLTAVIGALMIPALPPTYQGIAFIIIFLGIAGAVMSGLDKYVDSTP